MPPRGPEDIHVNYVLSYHDRGATRAVQQSMRGVRDDARSTQAAMEDLNEETRESTTVQREMSKEQVEGQRVTKDSTSGLWNWVRGLRTADKEQKNATNSLRKMNIGFTSFRNIFNLIKWPAIIAAIGYATQGLGALAGGATALVGALAPLTGVLTMYPTLLTSIGQVAGVVALAGLGDLKEALAGNEEALKRLTPEAKQFMHQLQDMQPLMDRLRKTAQGALFQGIGEGLQEARKNFPSLQRVVQATAGSMGYLAQQAGSLLGRRGFGRDFEKIGLTNARAIRMFGDAGLNLASALRHVLVEARPLTNWLGDMAVKLSEGVEASAKLNRENGDLAHFFNQSKSTLKTVGELAWNLAQAFYNIGKAGAPLGRDILGDLTKASEEFRKWTESARGRNDIKQYFDDIRPGLYEMGRLLRDLTQSVFRLSAQPGFADMTKQLRTELLPVLENVIASTTQAFGPHLVRALTSVARLIGDLAGASGPLTVFVDTLGDLADMLHFLFQNVPGLQSATVSMLGFVAVMKAFKFTAAITGVKTLWQMMGRLRGSTIATTVATERLALAEREAAMAGGIPGQMPLPGMGMPRTGTTVPTTLRSRIGGFARGAGAIGLGFAGMDIGMTALKGDMEGAGSRLAGGLAGGMIGALGGPVGAMLGASIGEQLGGILGGDKSKVLDHLDAAGRRGAHAYSVALGDKIRDPHSPIIKATHDMIDELDAATDDVNFDSLQAAIGKANFDKRFREIVGNMKQDFGTLVNAGAHMSKAERESFQDLILAARQANLITSDQFVKMNEAMKNSRDKWTDHMRKISETTGDSMKEVKRTVGDMKVRVSKDIDGFVEVTGGGLHLLTDNLNRSLSAMGVKKTVKYNLKHGLTPGGDMVGGGARQRGGWIRAQLGMLVPGQGLGDIVDTLLAPGSFVLNRNAASHLAFNGGGLVPAKVEPGERVFGPDEVAAIGPRFLEHINMAIPRFATGGVVPAVAQAIRMMTSHFPGLSVTSTTGGQHAAGSYHYQGKAVDLASGDYGLMNRAAAWVKSSGMFRSLLEGIHNPNLSVAMGATVPSSHWGAAVWSQHRNHIHLALDTLGKVAGGVGGIVGKLKRVVLDGPKGALRDIGQGALDKSWHAANAFLQKQSMAMAAQAGPSGMLGRGALMSILSRALRITGHFSQSNLQALYGRTMQESGGNPRAINNWDSNAAAGHPSKGLLQTIDSTFNAFKKRGYDNIWNPLHNAIAAIRYMFATYGHIVGPSSSGYMRGGFVGFPRARFQRGGEVRDWRRAMRTFGHVRFPHLGSRDRPSHWFDRELTQFEHRLERVSIDHLEGIHRRIRHRIHDLRVGHTSQQEKDAIKHLQDAMMEWNKAIADRANDLRKAVATAGFHTTMGQRRYEMLQLREQLRGDFESSGGERAEFIRHTLLPRLREEEHLLERQLRVARDRGQKSLVRELREALGDKQIEIMQQQLEAQQQTAQNTENLKDLSGALTFEFAGQRFTDLLSFEVGT